MVVGLALAWAFVAAQVDGGTETLYALVAGLASLVAVFAVLATVHYRTSVPLTRLADRIRSAGEADAEVTFETERSGQVGEVEAAVAELRGSMESRVADLEAERDELRTDLTRQKRLNRHLLARIDEYTEVVRRCSPNDLGARMDPDGKVPHLRRHAEAFNALASDIERSTGGSGGTDPADQFTITPPEDSGGDGTPEPAPAPDGESEAEGSVTTVGELKEIVTGAYPDDELPWHLYNRLFLKTGINLDDKPDDEELPEEEVDMLMDAARDIVGELTTA